ncbi:MAG: PH domain-containing protein [Candidatus Aenigmarchaeota archaeon]|nr:PH domain-containing protein [Candidatus Aenigmarchaeota archaeon]
MKNIESQLTYRTSRIHYLPNYIIVILVLIISFIISPMLNIFGNLLHLAFFFTLLSIASAFAEEPEWGRLWRKYIVTNNEIKKVEGLLDKKETIIPYQSVADVEVVKPLLGRILNVGTVHVRGFKEGGDIEMKGVRNPEQIQRVIQNKINLLRETTLKAWKKK